MSTLTTDPLNEKDHQVLPQLIHKYDNRVLCLLTTQCHAQCPFCFRRDLYEKQAKKNPINLEKIIHYLQKNPQINEFIFSGGEPLLEGGLLEATIEQLEKVKHLNILRIHSRLLIVNPEEMPWENLERAIEKTNRPIYFVIHVNSDRELDNEKTQNAIKRLRQLGYILLSHTVFLKNINDNLETLEKLFNQLVQLGIKPYYIFHCDNMPHTYKFIVPLEKERQLMTALRQKISGLAYPLHVIDSENGKIPVPSDNWSCQLDCFTNFCGEKIKTI